MTFVSGPLGVSLLSRWSFVLFVPASTYVPHGIFPCSPHSPVPPSACPRTLSNSKGQELEADCISLLALC